MSADQGCTGWGFKCHQLCRNFSEDRSLIVSCFTAWLLVWGAATAAAAAASGGVVVITRSRVAASRVTPSAITVIIRGRVVITAAVTVAGPVTIAVTIVIVTAGVVAVIVVAVAVTVAVVVVTAVVPLS